MSKFHLIIITLFLSVTILWCAKPAGTITGRVFDEKSDSPLPGVNISLIGTVMGAASNADGYFKISNVPVGIYTLRATMMGYKQAEKNVTVQVNDTVTVFFQLEETILETPELEVTANKRRQSIQDSPVSVGLMTRRDVKRYNKINVDEILEYASGVNFIGSQINIRGSSGFSYGAGSRVLFLVDGVPVMPGDSGDIKWNLVPTTQIERVEIIKGAGSALYGSSALGGVINIITKKASPKPETHVRLSSGAYDEPLHEEWQWSDRLRYFNQINIDHTRKIGEHSEIFVAAGRQHTLGYAQNSEKLRHNASAKYQTQFAGTHNLTISSNYESGKTEDALMWRSQRRALEVAPEALGDYVRSNKFGLNLFHRWVMQKNVALSTRLSYFRNYWKNLFHDNNNASTAHRYGLEVQGELQLSRENSLIFGTEESWDHVISGLVGSHDQYALSGYIQNERPLFISTLKATLGARYDYHYVDTGYSDSKVSPKVGLVWHAQPYLTFRASSGRGFRSASMSERFSDSVYSGLRIKPNPDLQSETSWSHDLALNWRPVPFLYLDVAGFWSDYWDLIEPEPNENQVIQFINLTRARITGVETMLKFIPTRHLFFDIGYTVMQPQNVETEETLAYRPNHLLTASTSYRLGSVDIGADFRYVSRFDAVKLYPHEDRVPQKVLDLRLTYHWNQIDFRINANNVFNYNYTQRERMLEPIRHYVMTVSGSF